MQRYAEAAEARPWTNEIIIRNGGGGNADDGVGFRKYTHTHTTLHVELILFFIF